MTQPDPNAAIPDGTAANKPVTNMAGEGVPQNAAATAADMAELLAKIDDLQERLLRNQADTENFRRRILREQDEARKFEALSLLRDLLPGLDGLNRATASAEQTGDLQNLLSGIRMVSQQFRDILKAHAAEPIDALGKSFDPNLHEALTQLPSAQHAPMTVLQVVEMGYRLHDRVVRPARVIVSCAPSEG